MVAGEAVDYTVFGEKRQGFFEEAEVLLFGKSLEVAGFVHGGEASVFQDVEAGDFYAPMRS